MNFQGGEMSGLGNMPPQFQQMLQMAQQQSRIGQPQQLSQPMIQGYAAGGGIGHMVDTVQSHGRGEDTELAHFTADELNVLDRLKGGRQLNPTTGLPEYGWLGNLLKGLVRAGAAIAGGMIAGPAGAAIGSGLATKVTGGSWSDALKGGAMSGIGSFAAAGLSGNGWDPVGKFGTPTVTGDAPALTFGDAGNITGMTGGPTINSASFLSAAKSGAGIAAGLGSLSTPLEGQASAAAPGPSGPSFAVTPIQRTPIPYQGDLKKYGEGPGHKWFDTINPAPNYVNPVPGGVDYSSFTPNFAKGGSTKRGLSMPSSNALDNIAAMGRGRVSGPGDGMSDHIPAMLSSGEHIVTSREISALGGGDTEAGHKKMYGIRKQILQQAGYKNTNPKKLGKRVTHIKVGIGA